MDDIPKKDKPKLIKPIKRVDNGEIDIHEVNISRARKLMQRSQRIADYVDIPSKLKDSDN